MATRPNIAGFRDAMERKREELGEEILFLGDASVTFPPGTPTDPETGHPYDPVLTPTASARASATATCEVAFRSTGRQELQERAGAFGWVENTNVLLIAGSGVASRVVGMTEFVCRGDHFEIRARKFDGVVGVDRYLIWGAKK